MRKEANRTGNSLMLGGVGYPQVMLISIGCGHTLFFNAVMLWHLIGSCAP
jgi:hypothetical protein